MTCNFKSSAGTDLDDLFYTNNGNAGALGFKNSSGTDLGNKYTNASTLGYAVGYKNSAGTDMGYLRGNVTIPELGSMEPTSTRINVYVDHLGTEENPNNYDYLDIEQTNAMTFTEVINSLYVIAYVKQLTSTVAVPGTFCAFLAYGGTLVTLKADGDYYTAQSIALTPNSASFNLILHIKSVDYGSFINDIQYSAFYDLVVTGQAGTTTIRTDTYTYTYHRDADPEPG